MYRVTRVAYSTRSFWLPDWVVPITSNLCIRYLPNQIPPSTASFHRLIPPFHINKGFPQPFYSARFAVTNPDIVGIRFRCNRIKPHFRSPSVNCQSYLHARGKRRKGTQIAGRHPCNYNGPTGLLRGYRTV